MAEDKKIIIEVELDAKGAKKTAAELTGALAVQRAELAKLQKTLKQGKGNTKEQREAWEKAAKGVAGLNRAKAENAKDLRNAQRQAPMDLFYFERNTSTRTLSHTQRCLGPW